jgi:hypothetical protein
MSATRTRPAPSSRRCSSARSKAALYVFLPFSHVHPLMTPLQEKLKAAAAAAAPKIPGAPQSSSSSYVPFPPPLTHDSTLTPRVLSALSSIYLVPLAAIGGYLAWRFYTGQ